MGAVARRARGRDGSRGVDDARRDGGIRLGLRGNSASAVAPGSAPAMRPNVALRIAWAASIVAVLVLGWGAYAWRAAIMEAWPASIRLYAALGLTGDH